jgi:hypothetical protein
MWTVPARLSTADGTLSACLASLLEAPWAETPAAATGAAPLARWQEWLAARNLRAVEPAALPVTGFWVGVNASGDRHVVMFGAPPDVVWDPFDDEPVTEPPHAALVLAPLDPALPAGRLPARATTAGTVAGLFTAGEREGPCTAVATAEAVAGRGLRGDRYFVGGGTFGGPGATGHEITLIAAEALDGLAADGGPPLEPADARRNVLTRGVDLDALIERRFLIGEVECIGRRRCEPCAHLQRLTAPGVLRGLVHRGGLRADIVRGGTLRVGDPVRDVG